MALPSYLIRRDGGRYHFQMRLGTAMATCLESSHLRFSLRTTDQRQARRRLVECLDWAYAFKEASDLEAAGAVILRSLEKAVVSGPPTPEQLPGRLILEDYTADFIRRSRERDFPWVQKLPGLIHLFKTFTAQNAGTEGRGFTVDRLLDPIVHRRFREADCAIVNVPTDRAQPVTIEIPSVKPRIEELLETVVARLDGHLQLPLPVADDTAAETGPAKIPTTASLSTSVTGVFISTAIERFLADEAKRTRDRKSEARFGPILRFMQDLFGDPSPA